MEIRPAREEDRAALVDMMAWAFPVPVTMLSTVRERLRVDQYLVGEAEGRVVAQARSIPLEQWFGGRPLPCAGIASVTTVPERRGQGLVTDLLRELLASERRRGAVVSSLYPATVPVYRRLGYEYGAGYTEYSAPLVALPTAPAGAVTELDDDAIEEMAACYRGFAATQAGLVDSHDPDWWTGRVLYRWPGRLSRAVGVRGADGTLEGYAAFGRADHETHYDLDCRHLVAHTADALRALLAYFRRSTGVGRNLIWRGAPQDRVHLVLPERSTEVVQSFPVMVRVLDVGAALEARGGGTAEGTATFAIDDPVFPENHATFRVTAADGGVDVEPVGDTDRARVPIGLFSAWFTGYLRPGELPRHPRAALDEDAARLLTSLFAGPAPWLADFF